MKLFTVFFSFLLFNYSIAQTVEYETGQNSSDAWTGWSAPVVTSVTNSSINGINIYNFVLDNSASNYSIEITKQISINSNDLDFYLNTTSESSTISLSISTDNSTWTEIGNATTTGFSLNQMVIPSINPQNQNFYVKIKLSGTIGSQQSAVINSLTIKADMNSPLVSVKELKDDTELNFYNNSLVIKTSQNNYSVSLFDISGKLLLQKKNLTSYNLTDFPKGIYFVAYQNQSGYRKTIKIMR